MASKLLVENDFGCRNLHLKFVLIIPEDFIIRIDVMCVTKDSYLSMNIRNENELSCIFRVQQQEKMIVSLQTLRKIKFVLNEIRYPHYLRVFDIIFVA